MSGKRNPFAREGYRPVRFCGLPSGSVRSALWREYLGVDAPRWFGDAAETDAVTLTLAQAENLAATAQVLGSSRWGVDDECRLIVQPTEKRAQELSEARCED